MDKGGKEWEKVGKKHTERRKMKKNIGYTEKDT
jgi:hypothetical protein